MRAQILLADSAQGDGATNKVHALGLGWSTTVTPTPPSAVIVLLGIPWDQTNKKHKLRLDLVDSDGNAPLIAQGPDGSPAGLFVEQEFEVGRPPGLPAGFDIDHSLAITLGPGLPLQAGQIYEWRLEIDGHHESEWSARFLVRAMPTQVGPMQ